MAEPLFTQNVILCPAPDFRLTFALSRIYVDSKARFVDVCYDSVEVMSKV